MSALSTYLKTTDADYQRGIHISPEDADREYSELEREIDALRDHREKLLAVIRDFRSRQAQIAAYTTEGRRERTLDDVCIVGRFRPEPPTTIPISVSLYPTLETAATNVFTTDDCLPAILCDGTVALDELEDYDELSRALKDVVTCGLAS